MSTLPNTDVEFPTNVSADQASDAFQLIELDGDVVTLHSFHIRNHDVASYLRTLSPEERAPAFIRAVEVGVFCLERASTARDTEFLKRQVERLISEMETKVGSIPGAVQSELLKKIGTGDGQVLKPFVDATGQASNTIKERITEVKQLFANELDPTKNSSFLGKSLSTLKNLLDPARKDSVQGSVEAAINKVTGEDGALAKAVKSVVKDAIEPLKDEVDRLAKEIRGNDAAEEAVMQTTAKGMPFEEQVVDELQPWAKAVGAELEHVGSDNRPGDVIVKLTSNSITTGDIRLVIEARDLTTAVGRKAVTDELTKRMNERSANAAIYLSRSTAGLGREIGDWCEGEGELGPWVATTHQHLHTAVRFVLALHRLRSLRSESPEFDGAAIENQIQRMRTSLKRVTSISTKVTDVRSSAEAIGEEANLLREEIRVALNTIEDAIGNTMISAESKQHA
jgi:archaellum component FlaC